MYALVALIRKDLILYFSNRRALAITVAAPIAIAAFFGSLFGGSSNDGERSRVPIAIVDLDRSDASRRVVDAMTADAMLDVRPFDAAQAADAVRRGKLRAVVTLPARFGEDAARALVSRAAQPVVGIRYDPSQAIALQVVQGLLAQHVMASVAGPALSVRLPYATTATPVQSSPEAKYNGYSHAFAGMGVQFILFMGIDVGVRLLTMRRMGLWQRMRAAPLSRAFLLASQAASGALIAAVLFAVIFAAGMLFFGVRVEGSAIGFFGLIVGFAAMTSTFGLFVAALGKTPEATRGLAVLATLVMVMLGGAWVPAFVFPRWLQTFSLIVPTRWAVDGFDAVTWRGLGLDAAWRPVLVLCAFSLAFAAIATLRFTWDEK